MLSPDTDSPPHLAPPVPPASDKRRPYLSLKGAPKPENYNQAHRFNRTEDVPDEEQVIVCRHLALLYCQRSQQDPHFHPSAFFASDDPRDEDPLPLADTLAHLTRHCRAWHLLPSRRFGEFLQQTFTHRLQQGTQGWALYLVLTLEHAMALRLRVKPKADGTQELVAQVYDPNHTNAHATARVAQPADWTDANQANDFLALLCAGNDTPARRQSRLKDYFTSHDPDAHIALHELQADATGAWVTHEAPCPLETNWCTDSRVQMFFALEADDLAVLDASIERFFDDPAIDALHHPDQLLEVPDLDRAVLQTILRGQHGAGQAPWEACWRQTDDMALKVRLLRGHAKDGDHLLRYANHWHPSAMSWWFGLLATLPASPMLEVLKIDDELGYFGMDPWLLTLATTAPNPWPPLLDAVRAHRPADARKIMAAVSPDGLPLLAEYADDDFVPALREWGTLLPHVSEGDRFFLLLGQDSEGISALYRAMDGHAPGWIALWGEWCASLPPASRARLLWGLGPRGEHGLWALAANHHTATMQAWIEVWRQLPDTHRAAPLAAIAEEFPCVSVLYHAMTGVDTDSDQAPPETTAFIRQWGSCLPAVPATERKALLQGALPRREPALWRGLGTGHWNAVVAWAELLCWVPPADRESLTELPDPRVHPLAQAVRRHAQRDPRAYRQMLDRLRATLPASAWEWLQSQTPPH